jgi:hypothetical protein
LNLIKALSIGILALILIVLVIAFYYIFIIVAIAAAVFFISVLAKRILDVESNFKKTNGRPHKHK